MSAKVNFPKVQQFNTQTILMASAQVALTWRAPTSGQARITAPVLLVDAESNGTEDLLLPIEAESGGVTLQIVNIGDESIVVKEDSDTTTIATLAAGATGYFLCTGTAWKAVSPGTTDFGSSGIAVDVIAESTAAAGVTVDGVLIKDGGVTLANATALLTDIISEKVAAAGVTVDSVLLKDGGIRLADGAAIAADIVSEKTAAAGVTADGVLLKDGGVTLADGAAVAADVISEKTAAAGVTIDGLLIKDERIQPTGAGIATGDAGVTLKDNLASAWDFKEGANAYLTFVTTNDNEKIVAGKIFAEALTGTFAAPVAMGNAAHTLVLGTAGAAQTKLTGNVVFVDAGGAGTPDLTLPAASSLSGVTLKIINVAATAFTVNTNVLTFAANEGGFVTSDGTAWTGYGIGGVT